MYRFYKKKRQAKFKYIIEYLIYTYKVLIILILLGNTDENGQ